MVKLEHTASDDPFSQVVVRSDLKLQTAQTSYVGGVSIWR